MKVLVVFVLAFVIGSVTVSALKCWLCNASDNGPKSFAECDANKTEQKCGSKNGVPACGMFIFKSKTGVLIHAKSCVFQHYCGANGTFCQNIQLGGSDCRLECCDPELCNYKESFKPTTPGPTTVTPGPTTSGPTTLNKTTPEINTERDTTTHRERTTEKETPTPTDTTLPTHETPVPDYDDEDDDCSWIDAGSTHLGSGVLLIACAIGALLYHHA